MAELVYTQKYGTNQPNLAKIPGQGVNWPEGIKHPTPPPNPPSPQYTPAFPLIAKATGPASLA